MNKTTLRAAVYIDRDGVINQERNYVHRIEDFVLLPGVGESLKLLQEAGYMLVVVTNQAGIGRGLYSEVDFQALTQHMAGLLGEYGVKLDGVYFCPHHPTHGKGAYLCDCNCRKPAPGMLQTAALELGIDVSRSAIIGDKCSDIEAGRAAGTQHAVLVESGHALTADDRDAADVCVPDLLHAAKWLLDHAGT